MFEEFKFKQQFAYKQHNAINGTMCLTSDCDGNLSLISIMNSNNTIDRLCLFSKLK